MGWFKDSHRHSLAARGIKTSFSYLGGQNMYTEEAFRRAMSTPIKKKYVVSFKYAFNPGASPFDVANPTSTMATKPVKYDEFGREVRNYSVELEAASGEEANEKFMEMVRNILGRDADIAVKTGKLKHRITEPLVVSSDGFAAKDKLKGGLADNLPDSMFHKDQLKAAIKVEREHTSSDALAKEIGKDHIVEHGKKVNGKFTSRYYPELAKLEKKLEKK
jgi:hypothetical protein